MCNLSQLNTALENALKVLEFEDGKYEGTPELKD